MLRTHANAFDMSGTDPASSYRCSMYWRCTL